MSYDNMMKNYFLIPTPNENNLIYLFITQTPEGETKHSFCNSWFCILVGLFIYKLIGLLDIKELWLSTNGRKHYELSECF